MDCFRLDAQYLGLEGAREASKKQQIDVKFKPRGDDELNGPKHGKDDPKGEAHQGGNTWAGGVS
jgi:von Willebrand factor A domain-containing protein 8